MINAGAMKMTMGIHAGDCAGRRPRSSLGSTRITDAIGIPRLAFVTASIHQAEGFLNRKQPAGEAGVHDLDVCIQARAFKEVGRIPVEILRPLLASHQLRVITRIVSADGDALRLYRGLQVNSVDPK